MSIKNNLWITSLLIGFVITAVMPHPQHKDENTPNNPALLQQQIEDDKGSLESLNNMAVDVVKKTLAPLKNVRNISDNQLSNEYTSLEHEDKNNAGSAEELELDNNKSIQIPDPSFKALSKEHEYEIEIPLSKKNNMGRYFTKATTSIPQNMRDIDPANPSVIKKDNKISNLDYTERISDHMLSQHTTQIPLHKILDNSSEENDEILPLAMKYYDEITPDNVPSSRKATEISSEDYYEDEYLESEPTTTTNPPALRTFDNSILRTLTAGFAASVTTISTTKAAPTPEPTPAATTIAGNIPIIEAFSPILLTTLEPLAASQPPQSQTQTMLGITTSHITNTAAFSSAAVSDKKAKQIPIISTLPVVTTTTTTSSRRRLLPHEQLRNYIEDAYIRMPLAVIVDPSEESLEKTKTLWNDAMRPNFNIKIILVTLNESEESPAAFNFNNTGQFLTGLNSIKEQSSGDAFRGILHAAELVPYDSALFISTAQLAKHTHQVQDSAITLLKKRIRLYLIWFGERSLSENETQDSIGGILGELAIRSGGEILHLVSSKNSQELAGSTLTIVADALRGSQEIDVPVNATLASLHVKIDKLMRRAILETPNGEINLKKLVKFKTHSLTAFDTGDERLDAYVPLTKLHKSAVYKLKVIPENLTTEYSVFIRGERKSDTFQGSINKHFETYFLEGHTFYPAITHINGFKESLTPDFDEITIPTHSKIQFPKDEQKYSPKNDVETFSNQEVHRNTMNNISSSPIITSQTQPKNHNVFNKINPKIEMGTHSQILLTPGTMGQLYFDVTNTHSETQYYNIQVVDEMRYLTKLTPQSLFLRPGEMSTVRLSVFVPQNAVVNTVDHITFSVTTSMATTSLTVNLKVTTTVDVQDNTAPSITWEFGSRCEGVSSEFEACSERFWNLYISTQDFQTGILRLQADPPSGLIYTKSYIVGTTEPLKAIYLASCCETKVELIAFDVVGNQRSYNIDVRDIVLTEASIAAIVLGSILMLLLVILIIVSIVWCCRRRKIVLDLPTYTSHSTRNMD